MDGKKLVVEFTILHASSSQIFHTEPLVFSVVTLKLNEVVRRRMLVDPVTFRRILTFVGLIIPAALFVAIGFTGCSRVASIIISVMAAAFLSVSMLAVTSNIIEIAPIQGGVIYGISNAVATLSGQLAPLVAGYVTGNISNTREAWQIVFFIAATISTVGGIVFMVTVKVEVLPWAMVISAKDKRASDDETRKLVVKNDQKRNSGSFERISQ